MGITLLKKYASFCFSYVSHMFSAFGCAQVLGTRGVQCIAATLWTQRAKEHACTRQLHFNNRHRNALASIRQITKNVVLKIFCLRRLITAIWIIDRYLIRKYAERMIGNFHAIRRMIGKFSFGVRNTLLMDNTFLQLMFCCRRLKA